MPNYSNTKTPPSTTNNESVLSAMSAGVFFIIIGVIFIIHLPTTNLWDNLVTFFKSFTLTPVPNTQISWLAPSNPADPTYSELYMAFFQFCVAIGVFNAVMLILRFWSNSTIDKKAETVGNIVFWLGTGYLITVYLLASSLTLSMWFIFWIWVLIVLGLSLIARSLIFLAMRPRSKT